MTNTFVYLIELFSHKIMLIAVSLEQNDLIQLSVYFYNKVFKSPFLAITASFGIILKLLLYFLNKHIVKK